jgi:hypothetical protein
MEESGQLHAPVTLSPVEAPVATGQKNNNTWASQ